MHEALGLITSTAKTTCGVSHLSCPMSFHIERGIRHSPWPHGEFNANLGYVRPCCKFLCQTRRLPEIHIRNTTYCGWCSRTTSKERPSSERRMSHRYGYFEMLLGALEGHNCPSRTRQGRRYDNSYPCCLSFWTGLSRGS